MVNNEFKIDKQSKLTIHIKKQSHSSIGQSTGLLNRGLKVQFLLGLRYRLEVRD